MPEHFFVEVAGALRRAEIHQAVTSARIATAFEDLTDSPLRRVQVRPLLPEVWARRGNLMIPDALYVVLAEHLGATLVTCDLSLPMPQG